MGARLHVGTSGWVYPHWRRRFYPKTLPARRWFEFYAERFATVELNNPFYRLPERSVFETWAAAAPAGFIFAVKASRFMTHIKRLRQPAAPLRRFLTRARGLDDTFGPALFQLPGRFHASLPRLDGLLRALERQRYVPGLRAVLEVRHPSWLVPEVFERLESANVALCLADWRDVPVEGPLTADFVYVRRHGTSRRYGGSYTAAMLRADARRIRGWLRDGRDVYIYFNNDGGGAAVRNALALAAVLRGR